MAAGGRLKRVALGIPTQLGELDGHPVNLSFLVDHLKDDLLRVDGIASPALHRAQVINTKRLQDSRRKGLRHAAPIRIPIANRYSPTALDVA